MAWALTACQAHGQTFSDVQYWVGSGTNQAGFVVDWNDGKNPQSLLWGFRWDGTATGEDMLHAIVSADPRFFANVSLPGSFGVSVQGMGYDLNNSGGFGVTPALAFDAGGYTVGPLVDGRLPADPSDHWREGSNSDGYWSYWDGGAGAAPAWNFASAGMSARVLSNNSWDGWEYAPGFMERIPGVPAPAVPTPAVASVIALGGVVIGQRRRPITGGLQ